MILQYFKKKENEYKLKMRKDYARSIRRDKSALKIVKLKRPVDNDNMLGYPLKEENCPDCDEDPCKCKPLQESGHTDVASMKTQVQIAKDALEKMNMARNL